MITIRQMQRKYLKKLSQKYYLVYEKFDIGERWIYKTAKKLLEYSFDKTTRFNICSRIKYKVISALIAEIKLGYGGNHLFDGKIFVHPNYQKNEQQHNCL